MEQEGSKANVQRSFLQSEGDSLSGRMDNGLQFISLPNAVWGITQITEFVACPSAGLRRYSLNSD